MNSIALDIGITIIHVFLGKIPQWFPYFLRSCEYNSRIQFIIFTNNTGFSSNAENVRIVRLTKRDFSLLITKETGIKARLVDPYKICDFRPAFGVIFKDYLHTAKYWGYCDNDIIFGSLSDFLPHSLVEKFDIISVYENYLSGPFCIYKNEKEICGLYRKANGYIESLSSARHLAFDENIYRPTNAGITRQKLQLIIKYLWRSFVNKQLEKQTYQQLKFNFQWYFKRMKLADNLPVDMTEVVWKNTDPELKVYFKQLLNSDRYYERLNRRKWKLKWENGHLKDLNADKEIFAFHFIDSKLRSSFKINPWQEKPDFMISPGGIC